MGAAANLQGWELTALFLVFLIITLFWDLLVGVLTFVNNILRGRKANWLSRVKEELLALGVVTLVLLFIEPPLQQICMKDGSVHIEYTDEFVPPPPPPPPVAYGTYVCPYGTRQVFSKQVIHAAHYLLFYLAIVHILFSLLTSVITNVKLSKWSVLERTARKEHNIPAVAFLRISSVIGRSTDPKNQRLAVRLRELWRDAIGYVDQDLYSLLRFMCEKRFRAHAVVLKNFNFLNMCEQCLEAELNEVYSHAWLLVFMMGMLLLYNKVVYQIVWLTFVCTVAMALMAGNLRWVMKKTAREARNLWRKIQGMGGLEQDDGEVAEQGEQDAAAMAAMAAARQLAEAQQMGGLQQLQLAGYVGGRMAGLAVAGRGGTAGAGGGGGGDLEAGDVGSQQRQDQLWAMNGAQQLAAQPAKQLRFAPRPLGESTEALSTIIMTTLDPAAAAAAAGAALSAAQAAVSTARVTSADLFQAPGFSPGFGSASGSHRPGALADLLDACKTARRTAARKLQARLLARSGAAAARVGMGMGVGARGRGASWEAAQACVQPPAWYRRLTRGSQHARPQVGGVLVHCRGELSGNWHDTRVGGAGGGGGGCMDGWRDGCGSGRRGGGDGGNVSLQCGAGPLGEGTVSNPLFVYNTAAGGGGGGGAGAGIGGGGLGYMYPGQQLGAAAAATAAAIDGTGAAAAAAAQRRSPNAPSQLASAVNSGVSLVAAAAASPYGATSTRTTASGSVSPAMAANGMGMAANGIPGMSGGIPGINSMAAGMGAGGMGVAGMAGIAEMGGMGMGMNPGMGMNMAPGMAGMMGGMGGMGMMPMNPMLSMVAPAGSAAPSPAALVADNTAHWGSTPSSGSPEEGDEASRSSASHTGSSRSSRSGSGGGHPRNDQLRSGMQSKKSLGASRRDGKKHGGGHGHGHGHGNGSDDSEDEEHSIKSMLEHELASGIEEKIIRLFFYGRPFLLLWVFNIIFAVASLTMTMSMAFVIPYDKFDSIRNMALPTYIWLPAVLMNFVLVVFGCWVFLPQYALLSVCGVLEPHEVMTEIKHSKTQDDNEEGVSAIVLEKLTHYFVGMHEGETRLSTAFIVCLASQAGIILGKDYRADKHINRGELKPLYIELMMVWHDIAWYGDLTTTYKIKTHSPALREAFEELDDDGSGELTFGELANMIRSLGTYATAGDVEAMLWEIDVDNSHSIGYDEFVKFLAYAFFDVKQLGYIDMPALMDGMERLGLPINEMQAAVMMSVGLSGPGEDLQVTLRQFFTMYEKVIFEDDDDDEGGGGEQSGSILGRALQALRAPHTLFQGKGAG
ncbi:hypothetical protein Agub_g11982, partial [Astrephomene gubernaculifera]